MLSLLLPALTLAQTPTPKTWYGPQEAAFYVQFAGNPYDPAQNDVKVRFTNERRVTVDRIAYFDQGAWRATLAAPEPGKYKATLIRNDKASTQESDPAILVLEQKLPHGFVRVDPNYTNRFLFDDGSRFYPMGFNLGWQEPNGPSLATQLKKMSEAKLTWTRIWATELDGKNPWKAADDFYARPDQLWSKSLDKWNDLLSQRENGLPLVQFVLFGDDSPPPNFFTDPEAKRRAKMWARYAISRWGAKGVFAWDLFGYTQDFRLQDREAFSAWLKEMADYVRSIDPHQLMVTAGGVTEPKEALDFYQPTLNGDNLSKELANLIYPTDKPVFVSSFSHYSARSIIERAFVRDTLWAFGLV